MASTVHKQIGVIGCFMCRASVAFLRVRRINTEVKNKIFLYPRDKYHCGLKKY